MITLSLAVITIATLTLPNVDFYYTLNNEISISDISQNNGLVEFEFDAEYYLYFETNSYPDFMVSDDERIGGDLFSMFVDIGDYKLSQIREYHLSMYVTYAELIVNIDYYEVNFDIDFDLYINATDGNSWNSYYGISRTIQINTQEQFTIQQSYELERINTKLIFKPRNLDNSVYYDGYEQGKKDQTQSEEIWQLFDVIFDVANNVLSVEILPGIRLWYLVGIPVFFLLLQFILNLFR